MKKWTTEEKLVILGDLFQAYGESYTYQPARHVNWQPGLGTQLSDGSWITVDQATQWALDLVGVP